MKISAFIVRSGFGNVPDGVIISTPEHFEEVQRSAELQDRRWDYMEVDLPDSVRFCNNVVGNYGPADYVLYQEDALYIRAYPTVHQGEEEWRWNLVVEAVDKHYRRLWTVREKYDRPF